MRLTEDQEIIQKIQKSFFPHAATVEENPLNFAVFLLFLSLRYSAELGRSRVVLP